MKQFSVLMSVYIKERSAYLDRALQSILIDQTVKPTELVLVEDGPLTDELYQVIEKYKAKFPAFISLRLTSNVGLGRALNAGLAKCSYEWVARMDSDDISMPERFEKQLQHIDKHPHLDVLGCAVSEFTDNIELVNAIKSCPEDVNSYIKFRSPVNHPTVFFKKTSVLRAGGYQHCLYMEDYHLWIRMFAAGMTLSSLPESLYWFKMDVDTQKRRGGWPYVKSESKIQTLLLQQHIISLPRYCANMTIRCGGRVIPGSLRSGLYKLLFRKKVSSLSPANVKLQESRKK